MPDSPESDTSNSNGLAPEDGSPDGKEGGDLSPKLKDLAGKALEYHDSALSENTRKAYQRGGKTLPNSARSTASSLHPPPSRLLPCICRIVRRILLPPRCPNGWPRPDAPTTSVGSKVPLARKRSKT